MVKFPSDVLFEIFSRLPIKSLLKFRTVSQQWRNIIDDPHLAYMHHSRCVEEPKILLLDHHTQNEKPIDVTVTNVGVFLNADLNLVAKFTKSVTCYLEDCCNGLLCLSKSYDDRFLVLFNPLRQQLLPLPPSSASPKLGSRKYGFWFDRPKNTYNIVVVAVFLCESVDEKPCYKLGAEVYTLRTSSWRPLSKGPPCRLFGKPIFACGALHWQGPCKYNGDIGNIVSFDVRKEEFGLISPPKYDCLGYLLDLGGNLAMVDHSAMVEYFNRHIDIWVMKEYEEKEWVKEYKIDLKSQIERQYRLGVQVEVIGLCKLGRILLRKKENLLSYNLETGVLRNIPIPGFGLEMNVLIYIGSLLSISSFH